jgi:hypothetical protein
LEGRIPFPIWDVHRQIGRAQWRAKTRCEATFDNLELRTYDVPWLAINKAVRLQWPASAFPFTVEGAPTVQGPWLPVLEPVFESGGVRQVAVPTSDAVKFFRLK